MGDDAIPRSVRERLALSALAVVLALAACGGGSSAPATTTSQRASTQPQPSRSPIDVAVPADLPATARKRFVAGRRVAAQSGCVACHRIGAPERNRPPGRGIGPSLNGIGQRRSAAAIRRALLHPQAPMPSYEALGARRLDDLVFFLTQLAAAARPGAQAAPRPCRYDGDCG